MQSHAGIRLKKWKNCKTVSQTFWAAHRRGLGTRKEESITVAEWAPLVDITEDDKEYVIKTELPEIKKEDVKVGVENGLLNSLLANASSRKRRTKSITALSARMADL